jgi:hypothetical protein
VRARERAARAKASHCEEARERAAYGREQGLVAVLERRDEVVGVAASAVRARDEDARAEAGDS